MTMNKLVFILMGIFILFCAANCKDPKPVDPTPASPSVKMRQISMGAMTNNQHFYSLLKDTIIATRNRQNWDLGFKNTTEEKVIMLNWSKLMKVALTNESNFDSVHSSNGLTFDFEPLPFPSADSAIIKLNAFPSKVYVIDRDNLGKDYFKIQVMSVDDNSHSVRIAKLDGSKDTTISVSPDVNSIFSYINFDGYEEVLVEPVTSDWEFCLSVYSTLVSQNNSTVLYPVVAVISNNVTVKEIAIDSLRTFNNITLTNSENLNYTSYQLAIGGFNWKGVSFSGITPKIEVYANINYVIRFINGETYKLHFTDYVNDANESGNPLLEFQKL
ncbi:MAG: hypothetical protein ACJAZ3_001890 [Sphingobacteriales bacterium]|jgi:hypothetical protein